ncbi:hypothetical protein JDN40_14450 [Rhodomicrobium vannielii ATCC 17100]|uniref:hypothetical protein n=1 Tax=Rhodomicrobium vannielii TaxID=1069 RepID=UPI001917D21F|nr:hypothetical protein [Rhodomicrobium vannielii]MBJ7535309.1 hypothetical protein [Rhodomicrobium vannielii ATCC 17100]
MSETIPQPPTQPRERVSGRDIWSKLSKDQREEIGVAALEVFAGDYAQHTATYGAKTCGDVDPRVVRFTEAAFGAAWGRFVDLIVDEVPQANFVGANGLVKLPSILGRVCLHCGCTANDACEGGCEWVTDTCCSSCSGEITPAKDIAGWPF